jgi:acyl-coenzyme A thioesterase PaaI-like protein
MTQPPETIVDDGACFVCGPGNPRGLGLRFAPLEGDGARGIITLDMHLQGYRGIAHGGVVMLLVDDVMAHAAANVGEKVMTAAVAVRFRGSVRLGVPLTVTARVRSRRANILKIEATIEGDGGELLVTAEGSFASVGPIEPGSFCNCAVDRSV